VARGGVEPPTFRFSGLHSCVLPRPGRCFAQVVPAGRGAAARAEQNGIETETETGTVPRPDVPARPLPPPGSALLVDLRQFDHAVTRGRRAPARHGPPAAWECHPDDMTQSGHTAIAAGSGSLSSRPLAGSPLSQPFMLSNNMR
jgi:hypothetical protein